MITKYQTKYGKAEIVKVAFDREQDGYLYSGNRGYEKDGAIYKYHDTPESAILYLTDNAMRIFKLAQINLDLANDFCRQVDSLLEKSPDFSGVPPVTAG